MPAIYVVAVAAAAALIGVACVQTGMPTHLLFDDLASSANVHPLTGSVSFLADILWFSSAAICFFVAAVLRTGAAARFLLAGAGVTALLATDDFFLLHDYLLPVHAGLRERYAKAFYLLLLPGYLIVFRSIIRRLYWPGLAAAMACFGGSVLVDTHALAQFLTFLPYETMFFVVEDGLKIVGIFLWSAFHISSAKAVLTGAASVPEARVLTGFRQHRAAETGNPANVDEGVSSNDTQSHSDALRSDKAGVPTVASRPADGRPDSALAPGKRQIG